MSDADEGWLRRVADAMPQLAWVADARGQVVHCNAHAASFDGLERDGEGWSWRRIVHPDDLSGTGAAWQAALASGDTYEVEHRLRMADGSWRWHLSRGMPVDKDGGRRWLGTVTDIDDLRRSLAALDPTSAAARQMVAATRELIARLDVAARHTASAVVREGDERYRRLSRATSDRIWEWDLERDLVTWSAPGGEERQGESGAARAARIHPADRERVQRGLRAALAGAGERWQDEYRLAREDGSYGTFLDRAVIVRDASGRARRLVGAMLDLSERQRVELALRESEERFRTLADNISQLAWIADRSGWIGWYNRRWFEYTGTDLEQMQGWGWQKVHHPDHVGRVTEKFRTHIASGEPWEDTFPLRSREGEWRWFLSRALPIRDEQGQVVRWFGTNTDVTAQREAEESLKEADRRKDAFLNVLAHELRNPLAPVRTAVELLKRAGGRGPMLERARDVIDRQVGHMALILDDLLDVSRIARGRILLRREPCDLVGLVRLAAEDYRHELESMGLTLALDLPADGLPVSVDRTRLNQVLGNLLQNAGKFSQPGGRVTVGVRRDADQAIITVADQGAGIEPALLPRLFDAFSQAEQGLDRSQGGLGLGLALVKGLLDLHQGTVEAASPGPGQGATFTVRLPLTSADAAPPRAAPDASTASEGRRPLRVVLIDDNRDMVESLRDLLAYSDCRVQVAFDGSSGIERIRAARPDLVLCDIGLPGDTDGFAVARAVRADDALEHVFMTALSGYGQEEDLRRSREAGFDLHLVKPIDPGRLDQVLEAVRAGGRGGEPAQQ